MADTRSVHETRFEAAVKVIQSLPKNGTYLHWYSPGEEASRRGLRPQLLNLTLTLSASALAYLTYFFSVFKRNVIEGEVSNVN